MAIDSDVEATPLEAGDIELDFVPKARATVTSAKLDEDLVLMNREDGNVCVLNQTGALIWRCFDGEGTLAEIAEDLAEVFRAPREEIRGDVLGITQWIGEEGVLEGVVPTPDDDSTPQGVPVGEELAPFTLPGGDGRPSDLSDLRGTPVLLVNWSPTCGYCVRIAPDLAAMQPALASQRVRLVFVTAGSAAENEELLRSHGLEGADIMLREGAPEDFPDPFPEMGTPAAYFLDAEGRVDAELAYGAGEVPELASLAGGLIPVVSAETAAPASDGPAHDHEHDGEHDHPEADVATGPRYLAEAAGVCRPGASSGKKPRVWAAATAYSVGDYHIGVRADSVASNEVLGRVFQALRLPEGTRAPDNFSVILGAAGGRGAKELSLLLRGDETVVRSRSPRRVVRGLVSHLSSLVAPDDGLLRTFNLAMLVDGEAVLLPAEARESIEQLQPRLARLGVPLSDEPLARIDLERLELVVPEPLLPFDSTALEALAEPAPGRSELPAIEPGRYRLRSWGINSDEELVTRAQALSDTWGALQAGQGDIEELVDKLANLFARVPLAPLSFTDDEQLIEEIRNRLLPVAA
jgi:thiol-disulfide isomerase/thioredoxin